MDYQKIANLNQNYTIIIFSFLAIISIYYFICFFAANDKKSIPRPRGLPFLGNVLDMTPERILDSLEKYEKLFGSIFELYAFFQRYICISDLKLTTEILMKRPKTFRRSAVFVGNAKFLHLESGLFHSEGTLWGRMRRINAPSFNRKTLSKMIGAMQKEVSVLVEKLNGTADRLEPVEIREEMIYLAVRVISQVAFGGDSVQSPEVREYCTSKQLVNDLNAISQCSIFQIIFPLPRFVWLWSPLYYIYEIPAAAADKRVSDACYDMIVRKRKDLSEGKDISNSTLIEVLLRQEGGESTPTTDRDNKISDDELLASIKTFFFGGSDTTAIALTWTIFYLSQHPEVLIELRVEVDKYYSERSYFGGNTSSGNLLDLEDKKEEESKLNAEMDRIYNLVKCKAAMKESIRLTAPANNLLLETTDSQPVTLSNGTIIYPNDQIFVNLDAFLWNPTIFPQPKEFLPERWLNADADQLATMDSYFLAFGAGPRKCPGYSLSSELEGPLLVAAIVRHFDFKLTCKPSKVKREFFQEPTKIPMQFYRRKL